MTQVQMIAMALMFLVGVPALFLFLGSDEDQWYSEQYKSMARTHRKLWLKYGRWWVLFWWLPPLCAIWITGIFG